MEDTNNADVSGAKPGAKPDVEPVAEPRAEPAEKPKVEPVAEPLAEPKVEPKVEPVAKAETGPSMFSLTSLFGNLVGASSAVFGEDGVRPRGKKVAMKWRDLSVFNDIRKRLAEIRTMCDDKYRTTFQGDSEIYAKVSALADMCDRGNIAIDAASEYVSNVRSDLVWRRYCKEKFLDTELVRREHIPDDKFYTRDQLHAVYVSMQEQAIPFDVAAAIEANRVTAQAMLEQAGALDLEIISHLEARSAGKTRE